MSIPARHPIPRFLYLLAFLSLLSCGAIFGFFYAWVCSTMWGLDATDPAVAIAAMQAMNASVRNAIFFPAFFLTPVFLIVTALLARAQNRRLSALSFGVAAVIYFVGGMVLTMMVNVPMNEALALIEVPRSTEEARQVWVDYSGTWQVWNNTRTVASGTALMITGHAMLHLNESTS